MYQSKRQRTVSSDSDSSEINAPKYRRIIRVISESDSDSSMADTPRPEVSIVCF